MFRGEREITESQYRETVDLSQNFPGVLHLDLTNHCNKACSMCFMKDRYEKDLFPIGYMDFLLYQGIINECLVNYPGQMEIHLYKDGESLTHPELGKFINYAKERRMFLHLATNGLGLYEKKNELMGLDLLTISVTDDTAFQDVADFMTFKGIGNKPLTQFKFFKDQSSWYKGITAPRVDKVVEAKVYVGSNKICRNPIPCFHLFCSPAITWDGFFTLCCSDWKRETVIGNVNEDRIRTLWRVVKYIRGLQVKGTFLLPCNTCHKSEELAEKRKTNGKT